VLDAAQQEDILFGPSGKEEWAKRFAKAGFRVELGLTEEAPICGVCGG
jgi:hypothetical protein